LYLVRNFLPYSGAVFDSEELKSVVDVVLSGRLVHGRYTLMFEGKFAKYLGVRNAVFVNSGSSANLLAVASLMAQTTPPEYRVKPGDEVITPALTFPTTLNPVLFFGLKPVFLDVDIATLNIKPELLEKAVGERTRVIFIPHTLGNPNDMDVVMEIAQRHNLLVIEDSCDALGSRFGGRLVGSFGVFGTF
jgi:CDP-6-deoxy-D-xylo-4-hexulose-3-dehydrase